ncbi:hypothetical protein M885DRAFT_549648 [Pelagophyceae sp. CCMP2097]|nr:hypothetical protein M885DRAFT_549648 [Pelagophyceae sp. CCMP2097]
MPSSKTEVAALVGAMQAGRISKSELFASLADLQRVTAATTPPEPTPPRPDDEEQAPRRAEGQAVAALVGAMRDGRLTKTELMASLSSLRASAAASDDNAIERRIAERQRRLGLDTRGSYAGGNEGGYSASAASPAAGGWGEGRHHDGSVARELREAAMWADLRGTGGAAQPARGRHDAYGDDRLSSLGPSSQVGDGSQGDGASSRGDYARESVRGDDSRASSLQQPLGWYSRPVEQVEDVVDEDDEDGDNEDEDEASFEEAAAPRQSGMQGRASGPTRTPVRTPQQGRPPRPSSATHRQRSTGPEYDSRPPGRFSTGETNRAFLDRLAKWSAKRDDQISRMQLDEAESTLAECTFAPQISDNSRRAVELTRSMRKNQAHAWMEDAPDESVHTRLYNEELARRAARSDKASVQSCDAEDHFNKHHPFAPQMTSTAPADIKARVYAQPAKRVESLEPPAECTFRPKINAPLSETLSYGARDVFDRLTAKASARKKPPGDDLAASGVLSSEQAAACAARTAADFGEFLVRQAACGAKRARRIDAMQKDDVPTFHPVLAADEKRRAGQGEGADFMARLDVAQRRRERRELEKTSALDEFELECTFRPAFTARPTRARPARSVAEMSTGDALRRETARRLLMLRAERDERSKHSFKPTMVAQARANQESRLRIASEPGTYLERLRRDERKRNEARQAQRDRRDDDLLEDATFVPKTTKCPTYITRIAQGMMLAKQSDIAALREGEKPTWR